MRCADYAKRSWNIRMKTNYVSLFRVRDSAFKRALAERKERIFCRTMVVSFFLTLTYIYTRTACRLIDSSNRVLTKWFPAVVVYRIRYIYWNHVTNTHKYIYILMFLSCMDNLTSLLDIVNSECFRWVMNVESNFNLCVKSTTWLSSVLQFIFVKNCFNVWWFASFPMS